MFLLIRLLTSRNFRVLSVAWSPDGKQIASGSYDKTIKIWDSQSGGCQSTLTGHSDG
jgi:WD40 repeat protein